MSYHLQDPYRYLPKCFPYIDPSKAYSQGYCSYKLTEQNREIESALVELKQKYHHEMFE